MRAIIDTAQAYLAYALNLNCGPGLTGASLSWRLFIGEGIDCGGTIAEQDQQRLAAAHSALEELLPDPSIQALKSSNEAMQLLTQSRSGIRIRGNGEAHSLGNLQNLRTLVGSSVAGLQQHEIAGLLAAVEYIFCN